MIAQAQRARSASQFLLIGAHRAVRYEWPNLSLDEPRMARRARDDATLNRVCRPRGALGGGTPGRAPFDPRASGLALVCLTLAWLAPADGFAGPAGDPRNKVANSDTHLEPPGLGAKPRYGTSKAAQNTLTLGDNDQMLYVAAADMRVRQRRHLRAGLNQYGVRMKRGPPDANAWVVILDAERLFELTAPCKAPKICIFMAPATADYLVEVSASTRAYFVVEVQPLELEAKPINEVKAPIGGGRENRPR